MEGKILGWISAIGMFALLISGCTVTPEVLTEGEIHLRATQDLHNMIQEQEPVTGPIDLYEAMARALKYNLDVKVEVMKNMLAHQQLDLSHYDLLPRVVANARYDVRSNFGGGKSQSLLTGQTSLEPSTGSERGVFSADLALSWDVLDFGLSYILAQQAADDFLTAEEEKRRVANRVMQEVRGAYWEAVSAERVLERLRLLGNGVQVALKQSRMIWERRLDSPLSSLQYQRELLATKGEIQKLYEKLSVAKIRLASLMNIQTGESYQLVAPEKPEALPALKVNFEDWEYKALLNRPELRVLDYRKRINAKETKAALLELMPNLNFNVGGNYNSNKFLFHSNWLTYGTRVSWNLLNVFRQPARLKVIEAQEKVLDTQRLAMSMTILAQVHVSVARYAAIREKVVTAQQSYETQNQIMQQIRREWKVSRTSGQSLLREDMNTLLAELRYESSLTELQIAYADVLAAVGEDLLPVSIKKRSVQALTGALRTRWESLKELKG